MMNVCLLILISLCAHHRTILEGDVLDAQGNKIRNALVIVEYTKSDFFDQYVGYNFTQTDSHGNFSIRLNQYKCDMPVKIFVYADGCLPKCFQTTQLSSRKNLTHILLSQSSSRKYTSELREQFLTSGYSESLDGHFISFSSDKTVVNNESNESSLFKVQVKRVKDSVLVSVVACNAAIVSNIENNACWLYADRSVASSNSIMQLVGDEQSIDIPFILHLNSSSEYRCMVRWESSRVYPDSYVLEIFWTLEKLGSEDFYFKPQEQETRRFYQIISGTDYSVPTLQVR